HYPFVIPLIQQIVGDVRRVRVIDPAPAVAKQVLRVLEARGMRSQGMSPGELKLYTSGDPDLLRSMLPILLGEGGAALSGEAVSKCEVERAEWLDDHVIRCDGRVL
ncbi:MAG: hypothetical protein ACXW4M_07465, partial [Anaerolineales bacterium]